MLTELRACEIHLRHRILRVFITEWRLWSNWVSADDALLGHSYKSRIRYKQIPVGFVGVGWQIASELLLYMSSLHSAPPARAKPQYISNYKFPTCLIGVPAASVQKFTLEVLPTCNSNLFSRSQCRVPLGEVRKQGISNLVKTLARIVLRVKNRRLTVGTPGWRKFRTVWPQDRKTLPADLRARGQDRDLHA
jgi:hypothetical protein